jgi:predicted membrane GTPase involved in stress response
MWIKTWLTGPWMYDTTMKLFSLTHIEHEQEMTKRKGDMQDQEGLEDGKVRLRFLVPARGLLGFRGKLMNVSHGQAAVCYSSGKSGG